MNPSSSYTRQDPYTREFECTTFPSGYAAGDTFKFIIRAFNVQGYVDSEASVAMVLASIPGTPSNAPTFDVSATSSSQIKVTYDTISNDGGSSILSYELQMGTLSLNDFTSMTGADPHSLSTIYTTTDVIKG